MHVICHALHILHRLCITTATQINTFFTRGLIVTSAILEHGLWATHMVPVGVLGPVLATSAVDNYFA